MPKYIPNTLFTDCYASVGNITFFHRDGECYFRTKANPTFPSTAGQQVQLSIHQRGLREWRNLNHDEQLEWNALAKEVRSKRLPIDASCHISGYNLFMSAYHGLACIGDERIPEPKPLPGFPVIQLDNPTATIINTVHLQISFKIIGGRIPDTHIIVAKIQLTPPGFKSHQGKFRNYTGIKTADDNISFLIHNYKTVSGLDLNEYQVHLKHFFIDAASGHRSKEINQALKISI